MERKTVILKPGKDLALKRFHPWVFSGAILKSTGHPSEGDTVNVISSGGEFLGTGHYLGGSLAIKVVTFQQAFLDEAFWFARLTDAFARRQTLNLTDGSISNAYRLVFSEGDLLPGLIIDYYNGVAVIQTHTLAMHRMVPLWAQLLGNLYGASLKAVFNKSMETMTRVQASHAEQAGHPRGDLIPDQFIMGESGPVEITEAGHRFMVDFIRGQKTGFFLDQRPNRLYAQFYARDRKVLNACCYSGAFTVYALKGGASAVHSLDSSKQALRWTEENLDLNAIDRLMHTSHLADVKKFMTETDESYDLIIVDPPAFAKTHQVSNNALHAYIHINTAALLRLNPGGLLMTFSCSQPISREMFRSALQSAAIASRKQVRIVHQLSQGPDHPVDACHPEGEYLKGLIVQVY
jgi:23S rRNA (cytosine1962-C5)-methyltransferase